MSDLSTGQLVVIIAAAMLDIVCSFAVILAFPDSDAGIVAGLIMGSVGFIIWYALLTVMYFYWYDHIR